MQVCVEQCMIVIVVVTLLDVKMHELLLNTDHSRPNCTLQPLARITVVDECASRQVLKGE